jgi:hypothetical protein
LKCCIPKRSGRILYAMDEKITNLEVVQSLLESPLSGQLSEEELADFVSKIKEMVSEKAKMG